LQKLAPFLPELTNPLLRLSNERLGVSFAQEGRPSLAYASNPLKGGIYRIIAGALTTALQTRDIHLTTDEMEIAKRTAQRFGEIPSQPGIVYAVEFSAEEIGQFPAVSRVLFFSYTSGIDSASCLDCVWPSKYRLCNWFASRHSFGRVATKWPHKVHARVATPALLPESSMDQCL
jgi:hypothetical protein